jgi:NAD-dependent dihydropyrimidine dehydrogenase PreA subunit
MLNCHNIATKRRCERLGAKKTILYQGEKCTGCRLCMLACSFACSGTYSPAASVIVVDVDEKRFLRSMVLDEDRCSGCLSCVSACPDGALSAAGQDERKAV